MGEIGEGVKPLINRKAVKAGLELAKTCAADRDNGLEDQLTKFWIDVADAFANMEERSRLQPTIEYSRNKFGAEYMQSGANTNGDREVAEAFFSAVDSITFAERKGAFKVGSKQIPLSKLLENGKKNNHKDMSGSVRYLDMAGQPTGTEINLAENGEISIVRVDPSDSERRILIMKINKVDNGVVEAKLALSSDGEGNNIFRIPNKKAYDAIKYGLFFSDESPMVSVEAINIVQDEIDARIRESIGDGVR